MSHEAFLEAIYAAPGDDDARLIYADWLGEQADAESRLRGEFIHLQYELHRAGPVVACTCHPKDGSRAARRGEKAGRVRSSSPADHEPFCPFRVHEERKRRAAEILGTGPVSGYAPGYALAIEWFTGYAIDYARFRPTYRRGFVEEIMWREDLLPVMIPEAIDDILARVPTVTAMSIEEPPRLLMREIEDRVVWRARDTAGEYLFLLKGDNLFERVYDAQTVPFGFCQIFGCDRDRHRKRGAWVDARDSPMDKVEEILGGTWPQIKRFNLLWRSR